LCDGVVGFVAGFQSKHPPPEHRWRVLAADVSLGHPAEAGFLAACARISGRCHRQVPPRVREDADLEEAIHQPI